MIHVYFLVLDVTSYEPLSHSSRVPTAPEAKMSEPLQTMNTFSLCLKPNTFISSILMLIKEPLTIFCKHQSDNDKGIERHPHYTINFCSDPIIYIFLLQMRHTGKINPTAHLKDTETPKRHRFMMSNDWKHKASACNHQSQHQKGRW